MTEYIVYTSSIALAVAIGVAVFLFARKWRARETAVAREWHARDLAVASEGEMLRTLVDNYRLS